MNTPSLSVSDFVGAVAPRLTPGRPQTIWDCEELFRRLLANPPEIQARLNDELGNLIADEHYLGDWLPNEWVLHRGEGFVLSVSLLDSPRRFIHVLPFYAMYGAIAAGELNYDVYRLPSGYQNDVFDPSVRLELVEARSAAVREPVRIESDSYAYDFKPGKPVPVLKFMTTAVRTLEWLFSRESLQAWQANDAYLRFTQLRVAADVLGRFAHQSSLEPLKSLTGHPHHAVRWSAIQNLARVNRSEAIEKLRRATNDPHPHVRRAALKTLDRLQRKAPEQA